MALTKVIRNTLLISKGWYSNCPPSQLCLILGQDVEKAKKKHGCRGYYNIHLVKKKEKEKPTSVNLMWIWACWSYHAQESSWYIVGFIFMYYTCVYVGEGVRVIVCRQILSCWVQHTWDIWWLFGGYNFNVFFFSDVRICKFLRSSMLLGTMFVWSLAFVPN